MTKKVIQPESNQDYAVESGELNQIIQRRVQEAFPGLFYGIEEDTGIQVKNYQFDRYCTLYAGLQTAEISRISYGNKVYSVREK